MTNLARRRALLGVAGTALAGVAVTATAATFGNPDRPPEGAINARNPQGLTDPGPQNRALADQFPSLQNPPATDVNGMPEFWSSFNNAHKRIQNGGWARQITQADFAISKDISGVNMRLTSGGIREMHWHQQAEWAVMVDGKCRITTLDEEGRPSVQDVKTGDLWYFPAGLPHSLQGAGPSGCEFVIAFDEGMASEFNTLLVTDWIAHTPPEVLAANFGVPAEAFKNIPVDNLWIFQGQDPGPLAAAQRQVASRKGPPALPVTFSLGDSAPVRKTAGGEVRIADSRNFNISKTIAAALVTVHPGGLRELHWHPNADEWQYYIKGRGRVTVFDTGPKASTNDFNAGDIGYVRKGLGHYVQNTGDTDLVFIEVFKADHFAEVSLSDWLAHTPADMVMRTLNIDEATYNKIPRNRPDIMPE